MTKIDPRSMENLKRPITIEEVGNVIKSYIEKGTRTPWVLAEFYVTFKKQKI